MVASLYSIRMSRLLAVVHIKKYDKSFKNYNQAYESYSLVPVLIYVIFLYKLSNTYITMVSRRACIHLNYLYGLHDIFHRHKYRVSLSTRLGQNRGNHLDFLPSLRFLHWPLGHTIVAKLR